MKPASPEVLAAAMRWAECMVDVESFSNYALDRLPLNPTNPHQFDGIHPAVRIEMIAFHRRRDETKRRKARIEVVQLTCPGCWEDFEVELHAHRGPVRQYCTDACKQKAYRTRKAKES